MNLENTDKQIFDLIEKEKQRQIQGLELIASENFTSRAVMQTLGTCLTNKYSEGQPGKRYYGGNEYIDQIEELCQDRALKTFGLSKNEWGVNVQALSGSGANFAVYTALLQPGDRILGLDLPSGGHLSHGYQTSKKKISATSIFFNSMPYGLNPTTERIDYDQMELFAKSFRPKIIIVGASAYPRDWDYPRVRKICDDIGAYMMADIAHISGLVLTGEQNNPFDTCDVVTTTTHKTLRGPRSGLIFCKIDLKPKIDFAVFPGLNGGPHNHQIAAVAVCLKEAQTQEFKEYAKQVKRNCATLAQFLMDKGYKLVTDGTDNHLLLWNLREIGISGSKMEKICEHVGITLNKNTILGDKSAFSPGGVRIGTAALTTRGFKEEDFIVVGEFLDTLVKLACKIQIHTLSETGSKKLVDFCKTFNDEKFTKTLTDIKKDVVIFSSKFFIPQ